MKYVKKPIWIDKVKYIDESNFTIWRFKVSDNQDEDFWLRHEIIEYCQSSEYRKSVADNTYPPLRFRYANGEAEDLIIKSTKILIENELIPYDIIVSGSHKDSNVDNVGNMPTF